eukprot:TRINITY_DN705_c0_g2_i1.p1 TRINITY_DN705_c0_g2~~TRINITY_DN705_c0_g2_i1.p1  ORF type:complete len:595 (-),score=117.31 TRINITY_DN705_c0_g2_i1:67-1749(-)
MPQNKSTLASLSVPKAVRDTWAQLQTRGGAEGVTRMTPMKEVLAERADLFDFPSSDVIELTEAAQMMNPSDGLPDNILGGDGGLAEQETSVLVEVTAGSAAPVAVGQVGGTGPPKPTAPVSKKSKQAQRISTYTQAGKSKGKGKGKNGYSDLFWTPLIAQALENEQRKDSEMVRALFNAVESHAGRSIVLSQLGSDFKVAQLKKDNMFKSVRLLDILEAYEDIFDLVADTTTGGWQVKLVPGAQAALPDAEEFLEREMNDVDRLPDRIENPRSQSQKLQSLRIELLYALSRRGKKVQLQELGQEPRVQQMKQALHQAKKLVEYIRIFPSNFKITSDDSQMMVELVSTNVSDQSMVDRAVQRLNQDAGGDRRGGPPSRNTARGRSPPRRGRSRSRSPPRRDYSYPPSGYGYGAPPPAYPYGYPPPGYGAPPPGYPQYDPSQQYPPPQSAPPPGYPPAASSYPPPASSYPPPQGSSYPPPASSYPPPASSATQPAIAAAPASSYPPPASSYPPPASSYPPPASSYPPPASSYPTPPASSYPAPAGYSYPGYAQPPPGYAPPA